MAFKTAWTVPFDVATGSRDSGDPLGFRAYANRLARELVPGLTKANQLTRGFSVLCLGLQIAQSTGASEAEVRDRFLRFERLWVASEVRSLGDDAVFPGKRRAAQLLADA